MFDESQVEQGSNFSNKLWNAYRLVSGWEIKEADDEQDYSMAINWFHNRFDEVLSEVNDDFNTFKLSEGLMKMYKLVWDDFCSWYLEMVKPAYGEPISRKLYTATIEILTNTLQNASPNYAIHY